MHRSDTVDRIRALSETLISRRNAAILTVAITTLFAVCDFTAPGGINVSVFYVSSVTVSGWTRSHRFLWVTTGICLVLTYAGLELGPQPIASMVIDFYINRSFVALSLVMIAAVVQQRMDMLDRIEEARDLQVRQNKALRDTDARLRRLNEELEVRVSREVARRSEAEQALHQAQKMEAIGRLTGGVAHDFNNILTTVVANLERIAMTSAADDPHRRFADNALRGAERGTRLTQHLLSFARRRRLEPEVIEIDRVLDEVMTLARPVVGGNIELALELGPDLSRCCADETELESAVLNLVLNARDAMAAGGRITIRADDVESRTDEADLPAGAYVRISVADTGGGMSPEVLARAFEPFFTTKGAGKGSGLGLSAVYGFAKQSGGAARIESTPNRGTTVHLYLPRAISAAVEERAPDQPLPRPERRATVLIVDDDEDVRRLAAEALEGFGYRVLVAADPPAAQTLLARNAIDLLLSDIVMPGEMSGLDLALEARRQQKDLPILLMTGYAEALDKVAALEPVVELLRKPFRPQHLGLKVRQMLNQPEPTGLHTA
ncbi:MAG: ATP-binding protein [Alphaproteobacteria bacterium]